MRANALRFAVLLAALAGCQALTGLDEVGVFVPDSPLDASTPQDSGADTSTGKGGASGAGAGGAGDMGGMGGTSVGGSAGQGGSSAGGASGSEGGGSAGAAGGIWEDAGEDGMAATGREFNLCGSDSDCVSGLVCRAMSAGFTRCTRTCSGHGECMTGTRCSVKEHFCAFDDDGTQCSGTGQCLDFCLSGLGTTSYCTSECASGGDCPAGWGCSQPINGTRVCLRLDLQCNTGADCAGTVCDTQNLVVSGCSMACKSASDCPARGAGLPPWTCDAGSCKRPGDIFGPQSLTEITSWACNGQGQVTNMCADALTFDSAPTLTCNETVTVPTQSPCVASCVPSGGCGKEFVCVKGLVSLGNPPEATAICVRKGQAEVGAACTGNEDCLFGLCKNQVCSRDCSADSACPSPFACASGVCL